MGRFIEVARNEYGLLEVVGVVESAPVRGPTYFVPLRGLPRDNMGLFVRVEGKPVDYVDRVREAVWSVRFVATDRARAYHDRARGRCGRAAATRVKPRTPPARSSAFGWPLGVTPNRIQRDLIFEQTVDAIRGGGRGRVGHQLGICGASVAAHNQAVKLPIPFPAHSDAEPRRATVPPEARSSHSCHRR